MAFTSILRKSASSLAPLVSRLVQGRRQYHCVLVAAINHSNVTNKHSLGSLVPSFHYSSESKKPSSEESLVRVIESEIKLAAESDNHDRVSFFISFCFMIALWVVWFPRKWRARAKNNEFGIVCHLCLFECENPSPIKSNNFASADFIWMLKEKKVRVFTLLLCGLLGVEGRKINFFYRKKFDLLHLLCGL